MPDLVNSAWLSVRHLIASRTAKLSVSSAEWLLQKLATSLQAKGLSAETVISASDEADYGQSLGTFLQYGAALVDIGQINTHSYPGE